MELFRDDGPFNYVYADDKGREVDVHLVDFESTLAGPQGQLVYGPQGLAYDVGAFDGTGTVLGRAVRCCTAEYQVRSHSGYELDADDIRDMLALSRRFGIPLLPAHEEARARIWGDSPESK